MMKKITSLLLLWVMILPLWAQFHDPVSFSVSQKKLSESEFEIVFTGKAEAGWHVYSTDIPDGGPTPATINFDEQKGVEPVGKLTARGKVHKAYDNLFGMEVSYMENTAVFVQKIRITDVTYSVKGYLNYGACNDENCMPPTNVEFAFSGSGKPAAGNAVAEPQKQKEKVADASVVEKEEKTDAPVIGGIDTVATGLSVADSVPSAVAGGNAVVAASDYWTPVIDELVEDIPVGIPWWLGRFAYPLCMADYPDDREFLPETFGRQTQRYPRCGDVWCEHSGHLCAFGLSDYRYFRGQCPECPVHECGIQHLFLPDVAGVCRQFLRCF